MTLVLMRSRQKQGDAGAKKAKRCPMAHRMSDCLRTQDRWRSDWSERGMRTSIDSPQILARARCPTQGKCATKVIPPESVAEVCSFTSGAHSPLFGLLKRAAPPVICTNRKEPCL